MVPSDGISDTLDEYYNKMNKIPVPGDLFGIDFVFLGGNCSIVVCCVMTIYIVNYCVNLIIRFLMLKDDNATTKANFFKTFQDFSICFNTFQYFSKLFKYFNASQYFSILFNTFQYLSTLFNTFQYFSILFNAFQ